MEKVIEMMKSMDNLGINEIYKVSGEDVRAMHSGVFVDKKRAFDWMFKLTQCVHEIKMNIVLLTKSNIEQYVDYLITMTTPDFINITFDDHVISLHDLEGCVTSEIFDDIKKIYINMFTLNVESKFEMKYLQRTIMITRHEIK